MNKRKVLAEQYGDQTRWVVWRYETVKGKRTKIPYDLKGRKASSTDAKTWTTYDKAAAYANKDDKTDGVGLVFTPTQTLLGIDIDHCITGDKVTHAEKKSIEKFIKEADTYCELSPSKEGLHLFLQLDEAMTLASNKKAPFELYTKGRYFTVTNTPFGEVKNVRTVTIAEAEKLLSIIGYPWTQKEEPVHTKKIENIGTGDKLDDRKVLDKMFGAKNGDEIKKTYDADLSAFSGDASKADMSLAAHLAFWSGRDKEQMQRIWMNSPLGSRKKTQQRLDYRSRTLDFAIKNCKEVYTPPAHTSSALDLMYTTDKEGRKTYIQNVENICRILRKHPEFAGRYRFDAFKNGYEIKPLGDVKWRELRDSDALFIQARISILFSVFNKVGKELVYDAILMVSNENECDAPSDYVKSLTWDKTPRLDEWLTKTYGTPDDVYHKAVAANWFKGMVKRIIDPGCKFDYVLVLEGPQGAKKSMSLSVLGGDWHVETTMSTDNKDFFMQFQGNIIVEFSEGETLNRTEVKRMKAIITTQYDKFRPPYGRATVTYPRRCVFAMTTNQEEYLKDETGNRRWLPVLLRLPQADIEWLKENRDQLFAEAYHRVFVDNEKIYEFPEKETAAEQLARRVEDPNLETINDWYYAKLTVVQREVGVTVYQCIRDCLHAGWITKPITKAEQMGVANVFKEFMGLKSIRLSIEGKRETRWYNEKDGIGQRENLLPSSIPF